MNDIAPLATFEFRRGPLTGSHLSLFDSCLEHRSADGFETMHLDRVASVGVAFERDSGRLAWGGASLSVAVLLLAAYWPLRALVTGAIAELNAQSQGSFLSAGLRVLDACVSLMPFASFAFAALGAALIALGWIGATVMTVGIPTGERTYGARGHDPLLREFGENVAARLAKRA